MRGATTLQNWRSVAVALIPFVALLIGFHSPTHAQTPRPSWDAVGQAVGQVAGGGATTWSAFLDEQPRWATPVSNALAARQAYLRFSSGDLAGALTGLAEHGSGVLLSLWETAGGPPIGTVNSLFGAWVAANDLARDYVFLPTLVDAVYDDYARARDAGETSDTVWESLVVDSRLTPVIAEIKRRVIRPELGLDSDTPDLRNAVRQVSETVAGRPVRITWLPEAVWPYGRPYLIVHSTSAGANGMPRFAEIVDIRLTGDVASLVDALRYEVVRLNERYRDAPNYLSSEQVAEVESAIGRLAAELAAERSDADLAADIQRRAEALCHGTLETRYLNERLPDTLQEIERLTRPDLDRAVTAYQAWLSDRELDRWPDTPPVIDLPCCRWWVVPEAGGSVLTGYYFNQNGDRIAYRSRPSYHPSNDHAVLNGFLISTDGIAYHWNELIAQDTLAYIGDQRPLQITRLGETVTPLIDGIADISLDEATGVRTVIPAGGGQPVRTWHHPGGGLWIAHGDETHLLFGVWVP